MGKSLIKAWFQRKGSYDEGLLLLKENGGSSLTVAMLEMGEDEYNFELLSNSLSKILNQEEVSISPAPVEPPPAPLVSNPNQEPENVHTVTSQRDAAADIAKKLELKKEAGKLWNEMGHLKGAMTLIRPGKALHKIARQILDLNMKRQDIWDQIDFFEEHGYWFEERQATLPPPDLEQQIKNVMSYRTKAHKKLEKPLTRSEREFLLSRIEKFNKEIEELKKKRPVK